jgi:hypothetical protein
LSTSAAPFQPENGIPGDPASRLGEIKQRRDESLRWMQENYWGELSEVYRAVKCRTKPIMVKNKAGKDEEDKNRTNVCMPELAIAVKRKTARLTANPPTLNYYVPNDDNLLAERLTARAYYEYDRSGEAFEFRRGVQQANTFGFTYFKTYYDTVDIVRQIRYQTNSLKDRTRFLKAKGASQDEIQSAVQTSGPEMSDEELAQAVAESPEIRSKVPTTMYEGPVSKSRFIGDICLEPHCLTLNDSYYVGEQYTETDLWLRKMAAKTYTDPESGAEVRVFDEKAVNEMFDKDTMLPQDRKFDLKRELRDAIQQTSQRVDRRLIPGKRFEIFEYHAPDKNGRMWIEYLGNDSVYLGRQPYPFDFGGRFVYTEYIPWPDLIGAIGDSSPRLLRFLHAMHNAAVGQRNDLISNVLRRTYKVQSADDIPDEIIERRFGRILVLNNPHAMEPLVEPDVPQSAWETEAQITSEMRQLEPAIGGVEAEGTAFNPQSGKLATTAILAAKSSDALTQFELENLNLCLKEMGEKKLEVHRQLADSPIQVPNRPQYVKTEALSQRYGKSAMIEIDPYEIQEPMIGVEPVAGSTLAVDDELRANKIMNVYQMAEADPGTWNKYEVAKLVLTTIKGVGDTSKLLNQPQPAPPPAPKISMNIAAKYGEDFTAEQKAQILTGAGMQVSPQDMEEMQHQQTLEGIGKASEAANSAANLEQPVHEDPLTKNTKTVSDKIKNAP